MKDQKGLSITGSVVSLSNILFRRIFVLMLLVLAAVGFFLVINFGNYSQSPRRVFQFPLARRKNIWCWNACRLLISFMTKEICYWTLCQWLVCNIPQENMFYFSRFEHLKIAYFHKMTIPQPWYIYSYIFDYVRWEKGQFLLSWNT